MNLEEEICKIKVIVMRTYKHEEDAKKSPLYMCYLCDGFNYNCIEYQEVDKR